MKITQNLCISTMLTIFLAALGNNVFASCPDPKDFSRDKEGFFVVKGNSGAVLWKSQEKIDLSKSVSLDTFVNAQGYTDQERERLDGKIYKIGIKLMACRYYTDDGESIITALKGSMNTDDPYLFQIIYGMGLNSWQEGSMVPEDMHEEMICIDKDINQCNF